MLPRGQQHGHVGDVLIRDAVSLGHRRAGHLDPGADDLVRPRGRVRKRRELRAQAAFEVAVGCAQHAQAALHDGLGLLVERLARRAAHRVEHEAVRLRIREKIRRRADHDLVPARPQPVPQREHRVHVSPRAFDRERDPHGRRIERAAHGLEPAGP